MIQGAVNPSQLDAYCRDNGFVHWFETSAKDGTNVEDAMLYLVKKILETETEAPQDGQQPAAGAGGMGGDAGIQVDPAAQSQNPDSGCGC